MPPKRRQSPRRCASRQPCFWYALVARRRLVTRGHSCLRAQTEQRAYNGEVETTLKRTLKSHQLTTHNVYLDALEPLDVEAASVRNSDGTLCDCVCVCTFVIAYRRVAARRERPGASRTQLPAVAQRASRRRVATSGRRRAPCARTVGERAARPRSRAPRFAALHFLFFFFFFVFSLHRLAAHLLHNAALARLALLRGRQRQVTRTVAHATN